MILILTTAAVLAQALAPAAVSPLRPAPEVEEVAAGPDPAELVRAARVHEQWIDEVPSFHVRFEGEWLVTQQEIDARRAKARRDHPEMTEEQLDAFVSSKPRNTETLEIAFDDLHVARRCDSQATRFTLQVWDGVMQTWIEGKSIVEPTVYQLDDVPEGFRESDPFLDLAWLRIAAHDFWWNPIDAAVRTEGVWGPIEDFSLVGEEDYHGEPCSVLESNGGFSRCWIDRRGFLRGFQFRVLTDDADAASVLQAIAARRGRTFEKLVEFYEWRSQCSPAERLAMDREYHQALLPSSRPLWEGRLMDWKEIEPGRWFPMTQGTTHFAAVPGADGTFPVQEERRLRAVEIDVGQPFPLDRFAVPLRDGVQTIDLRYDVPITYPYVRELPPDRREELLRQAHVDAERREGAVQARDALIGLPAPTFPRTDWLNSPALTWDDLRGQLVILDFWAVWCGPCRHDLPIARDLFLERDDHALMVIGVHAPGTLPAAIRKLAQVYGLTYPICIDVPGQRQGELFDAYRVSGIPQSFLVDREGRIAGHGRLEEMIRLARTMPKPRRDPDGP